MITETLSSIEKKVEEIKKKPSTPGLDNLNFVSPALETDNFVYVLSNTLYTPIPGWDIKIDYAVKAFSTLSPTTPTTQMGNVIIGNGTAGAFGFSNINTISPTFTQYAIIQYTNTSFNGNYSTTMSYNVNFPSKGNFKLNYYIQARPSMLVSKYNASHTIGVSIHKHSLAEYSFGSTSSDWGSWKKQELAFSITEPGIYPLTFKSTLNDFTGSTDSSIAFGAISFKIVS